MQKFFLVLLFVIFQTKAQWQELIVEPPYYIQTIQVNDGKYPIPSNILELNHKLYVSFDDLQADEKDYYYKIVRYDENWQPTQLQISEYIDGFESDIITGIEQSSGTLQSYTHYFFSIPNENTKILLSGNYIIEILDDEEQVVFSRAFVLYEKKVDIGIQIKWPYDIVVKDKKQMLDLYLYKGNYNIFNEQETLQIKVLQNNNWQTIKTFTTPSSYQGDKWVYHYPSRLLFNGLNEFRAFETKDIRGMNYGIVKRELVDNLYDFYVYPDYYRTHYLYYKDIDGAFIINSVQAEENKNIEADYVYVHFTFDGDLEAGEHLFVSGNFNDFTPKAYHELKYNEETGKYELSLLLKQGYYNYMYVIKKNASEDYSLTEGNFAQTENFYQVLVYYRSPGNRFCKVIGYGKANSQKIK